MGKGGWTADPNQIIVPPGATPDDPRIVIGGEDPIAESLSQDAAIVLYFGPDRAFIISVEQSGGPDFGQLHIWSVDPVNGVLRQYIDLDHDVLGDDASMDVGQAGISRLVLGASTEVVLVSNFASDNPTRDLQAYGVSLPRGFRRRIAVTSGTGAIAAETVVLTVPSNTYYNGRAYMVAMTGGTTGSVANMSSGFRIRKGSVAGQDLGEYFRYPTQTAAVVYQANGSGRIFVVPTGNPDVTTTIVLTLQGIGGNSTQYANLTSPRVVDVWDVGAAGDFPNAPELI